jgi:hypothetical protein
MITRALEGQMFDGDVWASHSNFVLVGGLNRTDADIVLYFLSGNGVVYSYLTDDPWYRGTMPGELFGESFTNTKASLLIRPEGSPQPY